MKAHNAGNELKRKKKELKCGAGQAGRIVISAASFARVPKSWITSLI
ncbi:hypothetical protein [Methanosarcina lacustris]|nr:hypothetical protein [Methanosarcina lacustris]